MKKALYIVLPIIAILIAVFTILFTPFGSNSAIKPIVNSYIQKKIKEPKIEITKLDSTFGSINLDAISNNGVNANANGDVNYFKKSFDLNYKVNAKSVKLDDKEIKVDLNINGQAVGTPKNFGVTGKGNAFGSDVKYKFITKDNNPQSINLSISSAQISKIFALLNQVPIIDGFLFVNANMPSLDIKNPNGRANIEIKDGIFNRGYINKKFKVLLSKDEKFKAKIKMAVAKKYIIGSGDINTTTAKLKIKKLTSSLNFKQAKAYYRLKINNLERLNSIANVKLKGKVALNGAFYTNLDKNILQVSANSKSLGGELGIKYNSNKAKITLKNVSIVKILKMLSQPFYLTSGTINGIINISDIKHLNGAFNITTSGALNKRLLKVKLPSYKYNLKANGILKDSILSVKKANLNTSFINLTLQKLKYSLLTNSLKTNFYTAISNLRALEMFTGMPLRGKISASGALSYINGDINLNLSTKSLDGIFKAKYNKKSLKAQFRKISLNKVLYILNQPHLLSNAIASGDVDIFDVNRVDGKFTIKSSGNIDTKTLRKVYDIDLGTKFKYALLIKNGIAKDRRFLTKPILNTSVGSMNFEYLNYDLKTKSLSGKYQLKIDNLRRLEPLVKQKLNGSFSLKGSVKYSPNQTLINGVANELGGVINFMFDNNKVNVTGAGISVVRALKMLNYEQFLDGVAKLNLNYNIKSKNGNFKLTLNEARFLNSKLVVMLKQYANFDLSREIFSSAKIDGTIVKNIITFNLKTSSQRVKISTNGAKIDTKAQTINAKVKFSYKNQDYNFKVSGPIKDPHIKLSFSGYIKEKVKDKVLDKIKKKGLDKKIDKEMQKIIPKEIKALKDDNKTKEKIEKIIPNEVKGLFKNML